MCCIIISGANLKKFWRRKQNLTYSPFPPFETAKIKQFKQNFILLTRPFETVQLEKFFFQKSILSFEGKQ